MAKIEIYSGIGCPYCDMAKDLLTRKGASYTEYDVRRDSSKREEMVSRAPGAKTIPQIFIDDKLIGGYDSLSALDKAGGLDPLLAA